MNIEADRGELPLAPAELSRIVEFGEADAWYEIQTYLPPAYAAATGIRAQRIGSAVALMATGVESILFNRVIGLGVNEPCTESIVEEVIAMYSQAGRTFAIQLAPVAESAEMGSFLVSRGFERRDAWAKVIRRPTDDIDIPTALRIEEIGPERAGVFGEVASGGFGVPMQMSPGFTSTIGRPGWRHYLGYEGETPVATGALYVRERIGWLGIGSTLPTHRGRGGQGAVMARRIRDAATLGCEWIVTETGEERPDRPNPSFHNMMRCGFKLAYNRPNYILRPQPAP